MNELLHIDLCCGLGGWQSPFKESPRWTSIGFDIRDDLEADVVADVRALPVDPDTDVTLLTISAPCTEFTKWRLPWYDGGAKQGNPSMEIVEACLQAAETLSPRFWIMENVQGLHLYWKPARKHVGPYYLWGEFPPFDAETVWKMQNQQPADRRSELSAKIPHHLADALRQSIGWHV